MAYCDPLVGIPASCDDNNLGSIKRCLIGSYEDVTALTVTATGDETTDGEVTAVTRTTGTKFEEFVFPKDTSSFTDALVTDLVADVHSWDQTVTIGLRRIDLTKRNALKLLAASRRDLIAVVQDTNGDWWMLGSDQGMRLTENTKTTNETRKAGQATPFTLMAEAESYPAYKVDPTVAVGLLTAAA